MPIVDAGSIKLDSPKTSGIVPGGTVPAGTIQLDAPPSVSPDAINGPHAADALIHSTLLGVPPSYAYDHHDTITSLLAERLGGYAKAGWAGLTKDSIIGEYFRGQVPPTFESHDEVQRWMKEFGQMAGDLPFYMAGMLGGALAGGAAGTAIEPGGGTAVGAYIGGQAGGFGLTAYLRQALVEKYTNGKATSFEQILNTLTAGGKGALTGAAMGAAGRFAPVATGVLGRLASPYLYKTAAELATMTTVGSLVQGRVPSVQDFVDNTAMFAAMHVGILGYRASGDFLRSTYVRTGIHPRDVVAEPGSVAPPAEAGDPPVGRLRPAVRIGDRIEAGEPGETHPDVLDRMVVSTQVPPEIPAGEAPAVPEATIEGEKPPQAVDPNAAEPERGFLTPDGEFLDRPQAAQWVADNEPEVHQAWQGIAGEGAEFHAEDYAEANRVAAEGAIGGQTSRTPEVGAIHRLLTRIRDGLVSSTFGEALRLYFVGERDSRIAETNQLVGSLRKLVPDYRDQEALTLMRDFKNRPGELAERRARYADGDDAKLKKLLPIIDRALNPTPEMLDADRQMTDYFTRHLAEGKKLGFLDSRLTNEEYITHLLRPIAEGDEAKELTAFVPRPAIGRYFPFANERTYPTVLDALETGKVKALSLNALDAMTIYGSRHATTAATKLFTNELKRTELGKWGFKRSENIPSDWVPLAPGSGLFQNIISYIDKETGKPTHASQMLMVPPKVRDAMAPIIEGASLTGVPGFQTFRAAQMYIKAAELGLSVFHMKALNITALNNAGVTGLLRSHGADMESPEFKAQEIDAVKSGITTPVLGRTIEAYRAVQPKTFPSRLDVLRELPGIKQVDATAAWLTHETFDVMQRKFKVTDYALKTAAWMAKHPEAAADDLLAAKRGIAKEINAAYGGLNWEVLGASKNFRAVAQAFLLAPDWTFSNVFNAKYAFEGGAAGPAARSFWIRSTLTGMAMTQAMSLLATGQMSSHPTEVYLGKDRRGKEVYGNYFFAGAPKDVLTFLNNVSDYGAVVGTGATIANKLSPVTRSAMQLVVNRDWMGRQIVKRGTGVLQGTVKGLEHVALETAPIPFSLTDTIRMLTDTTHDYGPADFLSVIGGSTPRHVLPPGVKPQRPTTFSIRGMYR